MCLRRKSVQNRIGHERKGKEAVCPESTAGQQVPIASYLAMEFREYKAL